jgi:CDP-diacylglycerol--glycerol-3-phosphate 3-phosphatidyltransferase
MEIVRGLKVSGFESSNPGNVMVDDQRATRFSSLDATRAKRGPKVWNIPNLLTLFRIFLVPLLVVVLLTEIPDKEYWGLGIFLLAALTDALDGIIARRTKTITTTGAMLDPIADKLLMSAAFISLVELQQAPAWMVTLIVGREFAVTALRLIALERGIAISANWLGKAKTTSQIITVSILIFSLNSDRWDLIALLALWITVSLTVASMVVYFWQNRGVLTEGEA